MSPDVMYVFRELRAWLSIIVLVMASLVVVPASVDGGAVSCRAGGPKGLGRHSLRDGPWDADELDGNNELPVSELGALLDALFRASRGVCPTTARGSTVSCLRAPVIIVVPENIEPESASEPGICISASTL